MAVVLVGTLLVLSGAFLRVGVTASKEHNAARDQREALYLAEAGVSEAGNALRLNLTGNVGSQAQPAAFGDGLLWVRTTNLGDGDYQVESTALCNSGRAAIRAVINVVRNEEPTYAVTSDLPLVAGSNFMIDSYNPSLGTYASQPKFRIPPHNDLVLGSKGTVGSNSDIQLSTNDRMYGDTIPGPGRTVNGIGGNTFVTGSTTPALQPIVLDPVDVPVMPDLGTRTIMQNDSAAARVVGPGDFHYSSLTLSQQAAVTIRGPATIVVDSFTTRSGCSLNIDASGGPVNVYFTGPATFVSNMAVTSTAASARSVSFQFASSYPIDLSSNAQFIGTIYAPLASVIVRSNWTIYGAISAKQVRLASNAVLHYDETLMVGAGADAATLTIKSWQRQPLPSSLMGTERIDPFVLLDVDRNTVLRTSDAYQ